MVTSKVTKKQVFTLSLEDAFLEKPQGGSIFMISDFKFFQIIFLRQVNFGCIVGLTDILGLL